MSAVRLCVARLTPLVAFAALSLFAGCTKPTPGYCSGDPTKHRHARVRPRVFACNNEIHTCFTADAANDAGDAGATTDAPADKPTDTGTNGDHPAGTDGADALRGDASDGPTDVFHGCVNNLGCPDSTKHVCQVDAGVCVGCLQNGDCTTVGARACDTTANKCVECVVNGDCADPTKPVCDKQACRACKADSECTGPGPGVCMFHLDGHCATDSETVYVAKVNTTGGCSDSDPTAGTSQLPFCTSQVGIDATRPTVDAGASIDAGDPSDGSASDAGPLAVKTLVVMRGPTPLANWTFNSPGQTVTVVGQANTMINPGAGIGIHLSGGNLYVRGLRVTGSSSDVGVVADGGEIHLDRCTIDTNQGGILINGAAYDITNTIVANNMSAQTGGCGTWAGVCLVEKPQGSAGRFVNNTVVANKQVGVACDGAYPVLGSIVSGSTGGVDSFMCSVASCCGSGPTGIDPTSYHLMTGSSCIDKLPANMSTAYDIDGDPRPYGMLSDCGADEYTGP